MVLTSDGNSNLCRTCEGKQVLPEKFQISNHAFDLNKRLNKIKLSPNVLIYF